MMKVINCLGNQEQKEKKQCNIVFESVINSNGLGTPTQSPERYNYIRVIAKLDMKYIFEAGYHISEFGTISSFKYIGTWNGVTE